MNHKNDTGVIQSTQSYSDTVTYCEEGKRGRYFSCGGTADAGGSEAGGAAAVISDDSVMGGVGKKSIT